MAIQFYHIILEVNVLGVFLFFFSWFWRAFGLETDGPIWVYHKITKTNSNVKLKILNINSVSMILKWHWLKWLALVFWVMVLVIWSVYSRTCFPSSLSVGRRVGRKRWCHRSWRTAECRSVVGFRRSSHWDESWTAGIAEDEEGKSPGHHTWDETASLAK